jgi:hypothetical protein
MLKGIVEAGLRDDQPEHVQRRVRLSNIVILLLIFTAALPFAIISLIYFPKLTAIPIFGAVACIAMIFINYWGGINFSRVMISIVAILCASVFNYILCGDNDQPIPSIFLLQLSFSFIIFVLFNLNEKAYFFPLLLLGVISIIGFPYFKTIYTFEYDTSILREGWLSIVSIFFAVLSGQLSIFSLALMNWQAEKKSLNILNEMEEKNKNLVLSENKMKENLSLLEKAKEEERKRNWATEGLANIADVLRNSHGENMFDILISNIVKYLKANQGCLFIAEENEEGYTEKTKVKLMLKACYAYNRKKHVEQSFLPGQGLIGQAYLEKSTIYMTEVPKNYVRITSGLGDANPSAVVVVPLLLNDTIEGVLELASFKKFEKWEVDFIERACETMASYIRNDRINTQTKKLLEESMHNSEQMRAQEEELRQNHEELMATQEEMRRQNEELLKQKQQMEEKIIDLERRTVN